MPEKLTNLLTTRELEILKLITQGLDNEQIAQKLAYSTSTIKYHLGKVYKKFELNKSTKSKAVLRYRAALIYLKEVKYV